MSIHSVYFAAFAFVMGAAIGSFLNVCIYRMPRNLSVNEPRRSFCPSCKYQIPWWNNLPLFSWLSLRGKCANCGAPISFRYFGVELLTGLLFLGVWLKCWPSAWLVALPYWVLVSLLVVATFIDFEFFIIPDEITIGGTVAGIVLSVAVPWMHGTDSALMGGVWAAVGAAAGYFLLWSVVELGKLAFGKKKLVFEKPEPLSWIRKDQDANLKVAEDEMLWSDFFERGSEQLHMECKSIEVDGEKFTDTCAKWTLDWLEIGERKWQLEKTDKVTGEVTKVIFPREAMGFGDVKFIACIGAFLGWKAVLFTVMAASVIGAAFGVGAIIARRREASAKIPFGPYLALGALVWLFVGQNLLTWYLRLSLGPE